MLNVKKMLSIATVISMLLSMSVNAKSQQKNNTSTLSVDAGKQVACDINIVTAQGVTVRTILVDIPDNATKNEASDLILQEAESVVVPQRATAGIQPLSAANGDILFEQEVVHFGTYSQPNEVANFNLAGRKYSWVSVTMTNVSPIVQSIRCYIN